MKNTRNFKKAFGPEAAVLTQGKETVVAVSNVVGAAIHKGVHQTKDIAKKVDFGKSKEVITSSIKRIGVFIKKHGGKAALGFGLTAIAGIFVPGTCLAVTIGAALFATVVAAKEVIQAKRKKEEINRMDLMRKAFGSTLSYGIVGSLVLIVLSPYVMYFSYLSYIYSIYFILA